uniref:Calcium-activated potassium channel subunit beta n=1 Tax=Ornithorhynchus anatinus TaxID=9258 RepID=A0A6I8PHV7_ORNAN
EAAWLRGKSMGSGDRGRDKIGDGDKTPEKNKKLPSNAGEERAVFLGFAMMGFSVLMFFLLGITILQPFMLSTQREESNCTAIRVHIVDVWLDCSSICAADCWQRGKYPCLQVLVNLSHSAQKVLLYYNEEAVQLNPKCFYTPKCHRARNDLLDSALDLKNFFDQKNGTPFSCFYRSDSKSEDVILTQKYDKMAIFHCLFWPSLTLLGGALIVGMVKLTQHLSFLRDKYPQSINAEQ